MLNYLWDLRDRRIDDWPLMSGLTPTLILCLAYVYIVKVAGPKFMEGRKPYDLKQFLILYNGVQVLASVYLVAAGINLMFEKRYKLICEPVDYSDKGLPEARLAYMYFILKFTEFIDTFAFVARKKFGQVSDLHVIHHSILPVTSWLGLRWAPGGHGAFAPLLNTAVHIVMYTYYMLAVMGPEYKRYIWWKKYLTTLQLVQFVVIFFHGLAPLMVQTCAFPTIYSYLLMGEALLFFALFSQFYKKSYSNNKTATNHNNNIITNGKACQKEIMAQNEETSEKKQL